MCSGGGLGFTIYAQSSDLQWNATIHELYSAHAVCGDGCRPQPPSSLCVSAVSVSGMTG